MRACILLLVLGHAAAGPSYRVPVREILPPPPPWELFRGNEDAEFISLAAFQRGAVESSPVITEGSLSVVAAHQEYGSHRYPLRDAVEALPSSLNDPHAPSQPLQLERPGDRVPLRDAVEHREAPFLGGLDHESIWIEPLAPPTLGRSERILDPKVICHLEGKAVHRADPFSLSPGAVPNHRCTHLIYSAATLDPQKLTIASRDPEYDEIKGGYKTATGLRARDPSLRILISVTAPNRGRLFSEVTRNECANCGKLAASVSKFLEEHDFDGVEIDWEDSSQHTRELKQLLNALRGPLSEQGRILAVAQRPEDVADREIAAVSDLVLLRAWRDSPGFRREKSALHPAPFKFVARVANRWIERLGAALKSKIVLGLPSFGQGYTLKFENFTDAGAPVVGPGHAGDHTKEDNGRLAYYEVCEKLEDRLWVSGRDEEGPYLKRGDQWIGYEDPISVKIKAAYVRSAGIGGVSLWSLDQDDFQGICGNPWPMLNAAANALGFYNEEVEKKCTTEGLFNDPGNCSGFYSCFKGILHRGHCGYGRFFDLANGRCTDASPEVCKPGQNDRIVVQTDVRETQSLQKTQNLQQSGEKSLRVVCYVTSWALYRKGDGKFVPERLDSDLCTDVVYAFAGLNPDTLLMQPFDPWADIENSLYERVTSVKGPRVLLALGGWTDSSGDKYSRLISSGASRRKFVTAAVTYLKKHNFNGLSLEWNYPRCWQSDCRKGPETDKPNFTKLVQELRKEFDRQEPRLTLAVALSGYKEVIDRAYEVHEISRLADFTPVMTYDYHGAWESRTGHLSPLFSPANDPNPYYNVNFTMEYLTGLGAERQKLLVGIPLYGQAYRLSSEDRTGLGDPSTGPGRPGEFTRQPGMLAYYEICDRIKNQGWKMGLGPSAYHKDQWVGYDDRESVFAKGQYAVKNGYGGVTMWTVDLDDFINSCCVESFPLLKSVNRALGRLKMRPPQGVDCRRPPEPVTPQAPTMTTHSDAVEGGPRPTTPMSTRSTTKPTTWPTWTEKPSTVSQQTTKTTWPSWTWTQRPSTQASTTRDTEPTTRPTSTVSWTPRPTQTRPTEGTPAGEKPQGGKPCRIGEYLPDPENCENYYRCVLGELKREQCAPGLHWDARRGICDWPSAAKCQTETDTLTTTTTSRPAWTTTRKPTRPIPTFTWASPGFSNTRPTRSTTTRPDIILTPTQIPTHRCEHGQYYAYPDSCTNFLVCDNGNLISRQCGPGLNWHREKNMCDWAFQNPCVEKPTKNALLVSKETSKSCIPGSYSGIPGDCRSYQACLWGRQEIFQCAPGLHFSKETHICDWPSRANCQEEPELTESWETSTTQTRPTRPAHRPTTSVSTTQSPWTSSTQKPWTSSTASSLPPAEISPDKVSPLSGHYKVVCYFTNWAWYRRGIGRYLPEHIDHTLCTHIVYGFAVLDYSELTIKAHDSWADYDNKFYERVVAYKKRGLKVLLALGGWNDSAGDKYSRLANNPAARRKFIEHAIRFLEEYGFDGLDLDWEYPVCWQVDCKKGPASDKQGFADLLRELSGKLKPKGLMLTAAVSPSKTVIDKGYDVPALARYLDWIAVMAYDYHGQWDKKTGHVAPLYYHPDDEYYFFNANFSINYWISKGAPPRSIVMGMPLYGQSFSINDPSAGTGLNVPASAGQAGEFTKAAGFLSYYEICDRIKNRGWKVVQDRERRMGPYAYKGSQWVSFDDAEMIRRKAQFVRDMGLGGGMVWALDLDDFRGRCSEGPHPLMHVLQKVLAGPPNEFDRPIKPPTSVEEVEGEPTTKPPGSPAATTVTPMHSTEAIDRTKETGNGEFKVICYFTNWAWYRQNGGKFLPEDVDTDLCTHVLYGFAVLDGSRLVIKSHDPWADIDNKFYERVAALKAKGIKVLMAIGGWNDSAGDKYSRLVNSPSARRRFIENVIKFIEQYDFEGLDLDWEYPVCWQVDCKKGPSSDKEGFSQLVRELSEEFKPKGLLLSAAVSPSKRVIDAGYDVPTLAKHLDWISVMTYDYHGQWDKKTGHVAPLYHLPGDWEPTFNANFSIHYWMEMGAPAKKLVMGAPLYGQSFSLAERSQSGLNAPTYGGGEAGEATRARGFLSYYEICERTLQKGWKVIEDKERRIGPYAYKGDQWVSFDDAKQIKLKAEFIKKLGLGGGMVWALDLDDFKNKCGCEPSPLLRTMNRVLRNYPKGPLCPVAKDFTTIDASQPTTESTTSPRPDYEPTTTVRTTYLPPGTTTTTPDIDDTVEIEVGPTIPPDCGGHLFIPHERDCTKYFLCNFGKLVEYSCAPGLFWNDNRCDWPENTKCKTPERQTASFSLTVPPEEDRKKVICYVTKWAGKRLGPGRFSPEDVDPELCTHIVYAFATLHPHRLTIQDDDYTDFLQRVPALKQKNKKVLLALGGWQESKGDKFSRLTHNSFERQRFAQHAVQFLTKYGFDGLDLVWEYPVCWQVNCNRGPPSDRQAFALLLKELNAAFQGNGLLVSAAVSASKEVIDLAYDVQFLVKYLDWISLMTYDYHGFWEGRTGPAAPLYSSSGYEEDYMNVNASVHHWLSKGVPSEKLLLGVPAYGQSFTVARNEAVGAEEEAIGPGKPGEFTKSAGLLAYYEICNDVRNGGWTVKKDSTGRMGPYVMKKDQWVSYNDVTAVTAKARLIKDLNLGGGTIWSLDLDDFRNQCGCGRYPLLTALNSALRRKENLATDCT